MVRFPDPPGPARQVSIWLTAAVGLLASFVAFLSVRGDWVVPPYAPGPPSAPSDSGSPVHAIVLVHDEPELPPGPHRETFVAGCTACHSPRLVSNQPSFPRATWGEEVHKMATNYGAHITAEDEPRIVDYLMSIRGR